MRFWTKLPELTSMAQGSEGWKRTKAMSGRSSSSRRHNAEVNSDLPAPLDVAGRKPQIEVGTVELSTSPLEYRLWREFASVYEDQPSAAYRRNPDESVDQLTNRFAGHSLTELRVTPAVTVRFRVGGTEIMLCPDLNTEVLPTEDLQTFFERIQIQHQFHILRARIIEVLPYSWRFIIPPRQAFTDGSFQGWRTSGCCETGKAAKAFNDFSQKCQDIGRLIARSRNATAATSREEIADQASYRDDTDVRAPKRPVYDGVIVNGIIDIWYDIA